MSLTLTELPVLPEPLTRPTLTGQALTRQASTRPTRTRPDALPGLRLVPAPVSEPPYDDELPGGPAAPATTPLGPLSLLGPALRLVRTPASDEQDQPDLRTPVTDLPPARPIAHALVQGLLEVLAGVRPVAQLQSSTSVELFARLEQLVHAAPRSRGPRPSSGAVRSVHVQELPDSVVEVCATVHRGARLAAIALRLEGKRGRWCCTDLVGV